jgi:hypothetical protein
MALVSFRVLILLFSINSYLMTLEHRNNRVKSKNLLVIEH